jgi:hypothetical protein
MTGQRGPMSSPSSRRTAALVESRTPKRHKSTGVVLASTPHPITTPPPPDHLAAAGRVAWLTAWQLPWTQEGDVGAVLHLAELTDEREALSLAISTDGLVLSEPIVTPKGEVVGTRQVSHPLLREVRRIDALLVTLRGSLGAAPMPRARLGQRVVETAAVASKVDDARRARSRRDPRELA